MSNTYANAGSSMKSSPPQNPPPELQEEVAMDARLGELRTFHAQVETNLQGVASEVVEELYNPVAPSLKIDGTCIAIMADLPEHVYRLIAIAVFNSLASNIFRDSSHAPMTYVLKSAQEVLEVGNFINKDHPKTEVVTKSEVTLGVLLLRIPSLARTLGFSIIGPVDGKSSFLLLLVSPFNLARS